MNLTKRKPWRSKAYTDAARGQPCTVCGAENSTIVFCHLNESWAGKGWAQKADDFAGFDGCNKCHMRYDLPHELERLQDWEILRAMYRTIRNRLDRGILR